MIEAFIVSHSLAIGVIGLIAFLAGFILPLGTYKIFLQFAGVLLIAGGVFLQGKESERKDWTVKMAEATMQIGLLETAAANVTTVVVTEFVPKIQYVEKVRTQVVKEYITAEADKVCTINNGFVRLHDAIAQQKIITPEVTDSEASTVKLSEVSEIVKDNYSIYYKTAAQLTSLQSWVTQQKELWDKK